MSNVYRNGHPYIPYDFQELPREEMQKRGEAFFRTMDRRRSVREFSDKSVDRKLIELAIQTASTAPSGAHHQPWKFVAVSDAELKHEIRVAAEKEEQESYNGRMPEQWLEALAPLGTDEHKPYLEIAPWLVVLLEVPYTLEEDGTKKKNYYVRESVGIAAGMFITALHQMGLVTLTHTPSPMGFLGELLGRPKHERPFILFPVGYPAHGVVVPDIHRKPLEEVAVFDPGTVTESP